MNIEIKNAKITHTFLGFEDHDCFTFILELDYGGSVQGVGFYVLDTFDKEQEKRVGTKRGMDLIMEILRTVGVRTWEDLPGKYIKARFSGEKVYAIASILKDNWLDFEEFLKRSNPNEINDKK